MTDRLANDQIRLYLPPYLSPERQDDLRRELQAFPHNKTIYSTRNLDPDALQGDGWRGFVVIDFHTFEQRVVSGIVLSNSCDIGSENRRALIPDVNFVPLRRLDRYVSRLEAAGYSPEQRASHVDAIKRQEVTSVMYLPAIQDVMTDSLAVFGDIHSQPLDHFMAGDKSLLFRLSDFGFYLFVFKLSIHFTRLMEGIER